MGNFHISIDAVGTHGQPQSQRDAANMARHFVQDLINAGHSVTQASVTHGGKDDVLNISAARPSDQPIKQPSGTDSPLAGQGHP